MGGPNLFVALFLFLLTASGGNSGNDLLDMVPADSYWRVKGVTVTLAQLQSDIGTPKPPADVARWVSDLKSLRRRDEAKKQLEAVGAAALPALQAENFANDPEAAAMARDLMDKLGVRGKERDVRRLMAIRTLGERREKDALPLLQSLLDSKELFVADYARRAIAQIEGRPLVPVDHRAELAADLNLFPADTGVVGQTIGVGRPGFSLESMAAQWIAMRQPGPAVAGGAAPKAPDQADIVDRLTRQWLTLAEQVGNLRIDSASLAISSDIGGTNNWFMVSFHGLCDRDALSALAASMSQQNTPPSKVGDIVSVALARDATLLLPSNRQAVLVAVDSHNVPPATVLDPLTKILSGDKGGALAENKPLDALLKAVDKSGPLWMVALPSAAMHRIPVFAPFDSLSLSTAEDKNAWRVNVAARGAADAQIAADQFNAVRDSMIAPLQTEVARIKDLQPLMDALQSATVVIDAKGATAGATVPKAITQAAIVAIFHEFGNLLVPPGEEIGGQPPAVQVNVPLDAAGEIRELMRQGRQQQQWQDGG